MSNKRFSIGDRVTIHDNYSGGLYRKFVSHTLKVVDVDGLVYTLTSEQDEDQAPIYLPHRLLSRYERGIEKSTPSTVQYNLEEVTVIRVGVGCRSFTKGNEYTATKDEDYYYIKGDFGESYQYIKSTIDAGKSSLFKLLDKNEYEPRDYKPGDKVLVTLNYALHKATVVKQTAPYEYLLENDRGFKRRYHKHKIKPDYEFDFKPTKDEDTPMKLTIENKTEVNGTNVNAMTIDDFIRHIQSEQKEIDNLNNALETVGGKSAKISAKIKVHSDNISKLKALMEASEV